VLLQRQQLQELVQALAVRRGDRLQGPRPPRVFNRKLDRPLGVRRSTSAEEGSVALSRVHVLALPRVSRRELCWKRRRVRFITPTDYG
jgi:hypothetical protein